MWPQIVLPDLNGWIEMLCLAVLFYYLFAFLKGTRGAPVLSGLALLFIGVIALTRVFHLNALNWLLSRFSVYLAVAVIVIFQPEIRHALAEIGKRHLFGNGLGRDTLADRVVQAVGYLARRRIGALIAIEQSIGTRLVQETGVRLDCAVTPELLAGLFAPNAPLHDGGVIIAGDRIVAARCLFPLSPDRAFNRALGMRHRAAVGLSEETDAIVLVVSEESGTIAVAHNGRLTQQLDEDRVRGLLAPLLAPPAPNARWAGIWRAAARLDAWVRGRPAASGEGAS